MRVRSTAGLSLTLGLCMGLTAVQADDFDWRPTSAPPAVARAREVIASSLPPAATLGRPIAVTSRPPAVSQQPVVKLSAPVDVETAQVSYSPASPVFRGQAPDGVLPPSGAGAIPPPPLGSVPGGDLYSNGAVTPAAGPKGNFFTEGWGHCKDSFTRRCGKGFHSDNNDSFSEFASPVSSPFLAEDPRSLTEVKPLFIYQSIPSDNPLARGGSVEFFGLQARLALTERWSIVMNKLGGVAIQPDDKTFIDSQSGFSELWIGPKYTFYRDEVHKAAAAVGLTFQIPLGDRKVFQDTGDLTLSPYLSFAKGFGQLPRQLGNFNYMSTTGFAFSTESDRSDYFYSNLHLDFDVLYQHRFYPLIELNWIRYINHGHANPLTFEGGDLFNFGSANLDHKNNASIAFGARYKLGGRDNIQFGGAFEFPISGQKDFNDFRVVLDVIFRF